MKRKSRKKIEQWEIDFRDEFGIKIWKCKGRPNKVTKEFDNFLIEKGLKNARKRK